MLSLPLERPGGKKVKVLALYYSTYIFERRPFLKYHMGAHISAFFKFKGVQNALLSYVTIYYLDGAEQPRTQTRVSNLLQLAVLNTLMMHKLCLSLFVRLAVFDLRCS